MLYEAADNYLKQHLIDRNEIPLKSWYVEIKKLNDEKRRLYREYNLLKGQTHEIEKIRKSVYDILRVESREQRHQKPRGMEL